MKNKFITLFLTLFALCLSGCDEYHHTHTFSSKWKSDDIYHWHPSTCGHNVINGKEEHSFGDWHIDKEPTETELGLKHKKCLVCDYTIEETIEKYIGPTPDSIVEKVLVTFDSNGGTDFMDSVELDKGSNYTLPICSFIAPENKTFDKWLIGEIEYTVGSKITVNEDITVKAMYRDEEIVVVPQPAYITIQEPTKLTYEAGDDLDLTGLEITLYYDNGDYEPVNASDLSINGYDKNTLGEQTITVSYLELSETFKVTVIRKYDEAPDSLEGVDASDLSALYNAFTTPILNYTSKTESYFDEMGLKYYYAHYQKNYVQEKTNIYTASSQYSYPKLSDYLGVLNKGYLNLNNNYYSYSLTGDDIEARLSSSLTLDDLTLVKENASYQDDLFTLGDLNQTYFENNEFVRVSANKYQSTKGKDTYADFIDICAPHLINNGYYMTFSKVTIELNPFDGISMRIRLYASPTQRGKLKAIYKDEENRPNWYLLFSEALIYDVNNTSFHPTEGLL